MKNDIIKLLETYTLLDYAYDDDIEDRENDFVKQYYVLSCLIEGVYEKELDEIRNNNV